MTFDSTGVVCPIPKRVFKDQAEIDAFRRSSTSTHI